MHTTPYRTPAKPVWPFLVPISRQPDHDADHRRPAEDASDSTFDTGSDSVLKKETGAANGSGNVVAFRFRSD